MNKPHLKRDLGLIRTTMLGVGGTISAANFVIIGHAAGLAGYAIMPIVLACGIISLFTMLSYAELGTAIPFAGGEYTFTKVAFGGFLGFFTGWFEWLSNMFYAALSAIGFAYVITYLIPNLNIPLTAVIIIIFFGFLNMRGAKETATAETIITLIVLTILAIFITTGWSYTQNTQIPIIPAPIGLIGIFSATSYLFELYLGAEAVAAAQAEVKNPEKNIPRAILLSAAILITLYTTIVYVAVNIVPPEILSQIPSPIAYVAEIVLGPIGGIMITIGLAIAGLAATNEAIMAQSRVLYAMSRDGYLPKSLSKIHKKFSTPHIAVIAGTIFTLIFAATGLINFVVYAVNLGFIIGFSMVNLAVIRLRKIAPKLKRPFKTPLYPIMPIAGLVTSIFLILFIEPSVLILGFELVIVAILIYYTRMIGQYRLKIAFGGISIGIAGLTFYTAYAVKNGIITFSGITNQTINQIYYILIIIAVIQLVAGILNLRAKPN